ncbi:MAG: hypothetical protein KDB23_34135, partial [Planctomycetales bacterium]|nr:hypothetical protein [Planctomycetales bacterium]
ATVTSAPTEVSNVAAADETPSTTSASGTPVVDTNRANAGDVAQPARVEPTALDDLDLPDDLDFSRPKTLADLRRERDETVWRGETLAQEYERALVRLWDRLIAANRDAGDPFAVFADQPLNSITIGVPAAAQDIVWDARAATLDQSPQSLDVAAWKQLLNGFRNDGFRIVQTEWHHAKFDPPGDGPARSIVTMAIYGEHPERQL